MSEPIRFVLGAQLRELRQSRRLAQEGLGEEFGVTPRYLAGIERGERDLSGDSADVWAEQFRVPANALLVHPDRVSV